MGENRLFRRLSIVVLRWCSARLASGAKRKSGPCLLGITWRRDAGLPCCSEETISAEKMLRLSKRYRDASFSGKLRSEEGRS